ncbi:hypothetical protein D3C80_2110450 [compost metagenome]
MIHRQETTAYVIAKCLPVFAVAGLESAAGEKLHFLDTAFAGMRHPPLFEAVFVDPGVPDQLARRPDDP